MRKYSFKYDVSNLEIGQEKRFYVDADKYDSIKSSVWSHGQRYNKKFETHKGYRGKKFFVEIVRIR